MSHFKKPRVLFVLKLRHQSGGESTVLKHSGLFNSATFVKDMLCENGYVADLVQVVDNNQNTIPTLLLLKHCGLYRKNLMCYGSYIQK